MRDLEKNAEEMERVCTEYLGDAANKPFSILELCGRIGISYEEWAEKIDGGDGAARVLKRALTRIAAGWEKCEGKMSPTMGVFLLKTHLGMGGKREAAGAAVQAPQASELPPVKELKKRISARRKERGVAPPPDGR